MNDSLTNCTFEHPRILHDACMPQAHDILLPPPLSTHEPRNNPPRSYTSHRFMPALLFEYLLLSRPPLFFVAFIVLFIHYSYSGLSSFLYPLINHFVLCFSALPPFCRTSHGYHVLNMAGGFFFFFKYTPNVLLTYRFGLSLHAVYMTSFPRVPPLQSERVIRPFADNFLHHALEPAGA